MAKGSGTHVYTHESLPLFFPAGPQTQQSVWECRGQDLDVAWFIRKKRNDYALCDLPSLCFTTRINCNSECCSGIISYWGGEKQCHESCERVAYPRGTFETQWTGGLIGGTAVLGGRRGAMSQVVSTGGSGVQVRQTETRSTCCTSPACQTAGGHFVLLLPPIFLLLFVYTSM